MSLAYNCGSNPWKVQIKFNLTDSSSVSYLWGGNSGTYLPDIYINENKIRLRLSSNGSSYDIANGSVGTFTIQPNTDYWVRLEYTGNKYSLLYSEDGINFIEDISVISSTHIENTTDISVIGVRGNLDGYTKGIIDLTESFYELNGVIYNFGYKQLGEGLNIKEPSFSLTNATITGTLTNDNGIYSGFNGYNYLNFDQEISLTKDFEFDIQVKMPDISTITSPDVQQSYQCIIGKDLYFYLDIAGNYDKKFLRILSRTGNGTNWIDWTNDYNFTYIPNQIYDLKLIKSGNLISLYKKSIYETEYQLDWSYQCTATSSFYLRMGSYGDGQGIYLRQNSYINMSITKFIYDGTTIIFNSDASLTIPQGFYKLDQQSPLILKTIYSTKPSASSEAEAGSSFRVPISITPTDSIEIYSRITAAQTSNGRPFSILMVSDATTSLLFNNINNNSGKAFIWANNTSYNGDQNFSTSIATKWLKCTYNNSTLIMYLSNNSSDNIEAIDSWTQICYASWSNHLSSMSQVRATMNSTVGAIFSQYLVYIDGNKYFDLQTADPSQYILDEGTMIGEMII